MKFERSGRILELSKEREKRLSEIDKGFLNYMFYRAPFGDFIYFWAHGCRLDPGVVRVIMQKGYSEVV